MSTQMEQLQEELQRLRQMVQAIVDQSDMDVASNEDPEVVAQYLLKELTKLRQLVTRDELTRVYNRRGFYGRSTLVFQNALRTKTSAAKRGGDALGYAVLFIDADNFKSVNDTYGHDAGDEVLKSLGRVCGELVRDTDCVARFGGEEFVIGLAGATEDSALEKAEEIRAAISKRVKVPGASDRVMTASIGVASLDASDADTLDELVGYADKAMYEAKTGRGKDTVVRWSEIVSDESASN